MKYYSNLITRRIALVATATLFAGHSALAQTPSTLPEIQYHLTARPWQPLNTPRDTYLDRVEGIVRYEATLENTSGAIIDPKRGVEFQYATPYFANCLGFLISQNRCTDLLPKGLAAMDHVTAQMANGNGSIPNGHGNFFIAPMAEALDFYTGQASAAQLTTWANRMKLPIDNLIDPTQKHNWMAYAMKGQWYRAQRGLVDKASAIQWIEGKWKDTQRYRFESNTWNLYHDLSSDPDTFAYDAATRANLGNMLANGYNGTLAGEMLGYIKHGTQAALLLQDASGQCAGSGRSGDHTWNDAYAGLAFAEMAESAKTDKDLRLAGQYRHASLLALQSVDRFRNNVAGQQYYFVTKNHFPFAQQVRYADYSALTNYNGNMMYHLAESWRAWKSDITEQPAPVEIGGYALATDNDLAVAVANAGGMQLEASLRGTTALNFGLYWSALGITRFSRVGWDSRLGPSDGVRDSGSGSGVSYAPTFLEAGTWKNLASLPSRYQASLTITFTHPLLVRARLDYAPKSGQTGPTFSDNLIITPDGVLSTVTSNAAAGSYGVTWPVLTYDGATTLNNTYSPSASPRIASVSFSANGDEQNYISLHPAASTPALVTNLGTIRSSYGDLRPIRMVSGVATTQTFIYPRSAGDPSAESVRTSFVQNSQDFSTVLGSVKGSIYVGRTSAGGVGTGVDLNGDGVNDVTLNTSCGFVVQLANGVVTAIEADHDVDAVVQGNSLHLLAYTPVLGPFAPVAPEFTQQPINQTVTAGQTAQFTVAAAGTAPVTYQWQRNGTTIPNATSPSYALVTTIADNGATFQCFATNAAGSKASNIASLTVVLPPVPVITSPSTASATVGVPFSYQITATNSPTSFNATNLPDGLSVNAATGLISGSPIAVFTGTVILTATNAGGTGPAAALQFTVGYPPVPAITSPLTASGTVGAPFSYQITATNSPTSFGATDLPGGLSVNTATGLISGTPTAAFTGTVTLTATNAGGTSQPALLSLSIKVIPPAPVINPPFAASGQVGAPFSYQITATNSPTSFNATGLPAGLSVNTATGLISGTPTAAATKTVTLTATNPGGTSQPATLTLSITIGAIAVNSGGPATGVFIADNYFSGGTAATHANTIIVAGVPNAAPAAVYQTERYGPSSYTISGFAPNGACLVRLHFAETYFTAANKRLFNVLINNTTVLTGFDIFAAAGAQNKAVVKEFPSIVASPTGTVTIQFVNGTANNATINGIEVTASGPPPAPVINSSLTATGTVRSPFNYQITATNNPTSFNATGLPGGLTVNTATGLISGTPIAAAVTQVQLTATNAGGTSAPAQLTLNVVNPPPPVLPDPQTTSGTVGVPFSYQIPATGNPDSYSATGLPPLLSLNTATGLISGTPTTAGVFPVALGASNVGGTASATLTITISLPPVPVINSSLTASGRIGVPFSYQITATNSPTSFNTGELPAGLNVNTATGLISGTPSAVFTGTVNLTATNVGGTSQPAPLSLSITLIPPAPVITSPLTASALTGVAFSYQITATNTPTSFAATGLPAGLSVNTATGLISGTPTATGTTAVTLKATNAGGTSQPVTLTLSVTVGAIAINAGGPVAGVFIADNYFSGGTAANHPNAINTSGVANPAPAVVYQTERYGSCSYTITGFAPNGDCLVRLHFAETYFTAANKRLFNVLINNTTVLTGFDIFVAAGAQNKAVVKEFPSIAASPTGTVTIQFVNGTVNNAKIDGIEIIAFPAAQSPAMVAPLSASGSVGVPFSYQIPDAANALGFSVDELPAGLTLDAETGLITGTPTAAETSSAIVTVVNSDGTTTQETLDFSILPAL